MISSGRFLNFKHFKFYLFVYLLLLLRVHLEYRVNAVTRANLEEQ